MYALQTLDLLQLENVTWASRPEDLSVPTQSLLQFQVGFQSWSHHGASIIYIIAHFQPVSLPPAAAKSHACTHAYITMLAAPILEKRQLLSKPTKAFKQLWKSDKHVGVDWQLLMCFCSQALHAQAKLSCSSQIACKSRYSSHWPLCTIIASMTRTGILLEWHAMATCCRKMQLMMPI